MIRVLIADDHDMVRKGVRSWLESERDIIVIYEASTGKEALEKIMELQPDVVLLDLHFPDRDGMSVIRDVRAAGCKIPILVMTGYERQRARVVLAAGANGFLNKEESRERIIEAVRWAASGEAGTWLGPRAATELMKSEAVIDTLGLSKTELKVLGLIQLTNTQIAEKIFITEGTVKNHITSIYSKLGVSNRMEALAWAKLQGLVSDPLQG